MIPAAFAYVRAGSLDDALERLADADGAKVLAGGQSLLPLMKLRLARPEMIIDIGRLDELRGIRPLADGRIAIGALTTYAEMLSHPLITAYGLLRDALPAIGDLQVRNRGTIGGSIAHVDPASDMPAVLLALDAEIVVRSTTAERLIPISTFFVGPFESALDPAELVTEIRLPCLTEDVGSAYRSINQPASGYAIAGAAVVIRSRVDERLGRCAVGVTGVGEIPYRATAVEEAVRDGASFAEAASHVADGITVTSDLHADVEYRSHVASVEVRRALEAAVARPG